MSSIASITEAVRSVCGSDMRADDSKAEYSCSDETQGPEGEADGAIDEKQDKRRAIHMFPALMVPDLRQPSCVTRWLCPRLPVSTPRGSIVCGSGVD